MSVNRRVCLAVALLFGGGVLYTTWLSPSTIRTAAGLAPYMREWFDSKEEKWRALEVVPLADERAVTDAVGTMVASGHTPIPFDKASLIRDLSTFLVALRADGPDTYLASLGSTRALRADALVDDGNVYAYYDGCFGTSMPADLNSRDAMREFWDATDASIGGPYAISPYASLEVFESSPLETSEPSPASNLVSQISKRRPVYDIARRGLFVGSYDWGFPRLTEPSTTLAQVIRRTKTTRLCSVAFLLEATTGARFPITVLMYYAPSESRWHVEWLTHRYPGRLCRPF